MSQNNIISSAADFPSKNAIHTPSASTVIMTELVLPTHTNALGTIFGGVVMSWIDIAAAIAAGKHARRSVVTASIDALHFKAPIKVGHVVLLSARVNYAHRTSMEVGIRVDSENLITGERHHNVTAYATFVALNEHGRSCAVPPLQPESEEDRRRYKEAEQRRANRIALAQTIRGSKT